MKKLLLALLVIQTATLTLMAQRNVIDENGGFVAVLPGGELVRGDNDPSEYWKWENANHYRSLGGTGAVQINTNQNTLIEIIKSINSFASGAIHASSSFGSELTIDSSENTIVKNLNDSGAGILIEGGTKVTINEGIYDGHQNQHWSLAPAGANISGVNNLTINRASFLGGDSIVGWSHGDGTEGLRLNGTGGGMNIVFNYDKDESKNSILGGSSRRTSAWSDNQIDEPNYIYNPGNAGGKNGGSGIAIGGSVHITSTNLYVTAGAAGALDFRAIRFVNSTFEAHADGGSGISGIRSGGQRFPSAPDTVTLNMQSGRIIATDGGTLGFGTKVGDDWSLNFHADGGHAINGGPGSGMLSNVTLIAGNGGEIILNTEITSGATTFFLSGGHGINGVAANAKIIDSKFIGGNGSVAPMGLMAGTAVIHANGGMAMRNTHVVAANLLRGFYDGGNGGTIIARITGNNATSLFNSNGGAAFVGTINSTNGWFSGGNAGTIKIQGDTVTASARGGHGALISDNTALINSSSTISGGHFLGGYGGIASLTKGSAFATAGNGVSFTGDAGDTLTIYGGEFKGGIGGVAWGSIIAEAQGGHGIYVTGGGTLNIRGGTFTGGAGGAAGGVGTPLSSRGMGVYAVNSSVNIDGIDAVINGGMVFENNTAQNLNILAGTIKGNIDVQGSGTTTMRVSEHANFSDLFNQSGGRINVQLNAPEDSRFFSGVNIADGTMSFESQPAVLGANASFVLSGGTNSILNFAQGAELSPGAMVLAHMGQVTSDSNLVLRSNSSIDFDVDFLAGTNGTLTISGGNGLILNRGSRVSVSGIAYDESGQVNLATVGSVDSGDNALSDVLVGDFGWLTRVTDIATNGNIIFDFDYNSQTNSLGDLDPALLSYMDGMITNFSAADFYALNRVGGIKGPAQLRYNHTQMPDIVEVSFEVGRKINEQITARSAEFRSMNGFATTKSKPAGVAGPEEKENTMKGWVRAYGSMAEREKDSHFPGYDASSWGTVIGVDKSFGSLLVGLAGGYAVSDLEGHAYTADVTIHHGTFYSSFGGESMFIDLACTYGQAETKERIQGLSKTTDFDSEVLSMYAGVGKALGISDWINFTPQVSLLSTHYDQQSFNRKEPLPVSVPDYDEWSYLGSFGFSLSSLHQIDLMRRGLAVYPDIHAHWLHEFNSDPSDLKFTSDGGAVGVSTRPREENLFRLGLGLDLWSWRYKAAKLEFDFDVLMSSNYEEYIGGGKISLKF